MNNGIKLTTGRLIQWRTMAFCGSEKMPDYGAEPLAPNELHGGKSHEFALPLPVPGGSATARKRHHFLPQTTQRSASAMVAPPACLFRWVGSSSSRSFHQNSTNRPQPFVKRRPPWPTVGSAVRSTHRPIGTLWPTPSANTSATTDTSFRTASGNTSIGPVRTTMAAGIRRRLRHASVNATVALFAMMYHDIHFQSLLIITQPMFVSFPWSRSSS